MLALLILLLQHARLVGRFSTAGPGIVTINRHIDRRAYCDQERPGLGCHSGLCDIANEVRSLQAD